MATFFQQDACSACLSCCRYFFFFLFACYLSCFNFFLSFLIGVSTFFSLTWKAFNNFFTFFTDCGTVDFKKFGKWAVVTGSTDGIGEAFAEQLAAKGLNIVLISRTQDKLEEQSSYLTKKYNVRTKFIVADFTDQEKVYAKIITDLDEVYNDIAVLVNNVGMVYKSAHPDYFHVAIGENLQNINDIINCNMVSVAKMSAIVLPGMIDRKGGVIINISSGTGMVVSPLYSLYSGTKAFVDYFTKGIHTEYESKGIIIQSLAPFAVSTKISKVPASFLTPSPKDFVKYALKTTGSQSYSSSGYLIHNVLLWFVTNLFPEKFTANIVFYLLKFKRQWELNKKD